MKEIIGLIIVITLGVYVYGSTFLFWYWAFEGKQEVIGGSDNNRYYYVFMGSLVGIGIFFYGGFDKLLFFIPESWGSIDEGGDFVTTRSLFAGMLAMFATITVHAKPFQLIKFFKSKDD
jgi:hypothetical protein